MQRSAGESFHESILRSNMKKEGLYGYGVSSRVNE